MLKRKLEPLTYLIKLEKVTEKNESKESSDYNDAASGSSQRQCTED